MVSDACDDCQAVNAYFIIIIIIFYLSQVSYVQEVAKGIFDE